MPEPGAIFFAPDPDAVHDQGDEPVYVCPACTGGWHGQQCQGEFWTTDTPSILVDCDCTDGTCQGRWVEVGYTEVDELLAERSGAAALRAEEAARRRPTGAQPFTDEGAIGPPIPVTTEVRPDGVYASGVIPPGHPAYAAVHAGLTTSLSIADEAVDFPADNGRSVNSVDTRTPVRAGFQAVPVPSPAVTTGLGREHIDTHRHIPKPDRIELPEQLGGLPEDHPGCEQVRLNRADRRRLLKDARKAARRGH